MSKFGMLGAFVFNAFDIGAYSYFNKAKFEDLCCELELQTVPPIGKVEVPDSIDAIVEVAEG
jgi:hypothetical protein